MLYSFCIGLILVASVMLILAVLVQSPKSDHRYGRQQGFDEQQRSSAGRQRVDGEGERHGCRRGYAFGGDSFVGCSRGCARRGRVTEVTAIPSPQRRGRQKKKTPCLSEAGCIFLRYFVGRESPRNAFPRNRRHNGSAYKKSGTEIKQPCTMKLFHQSPYPLVLYTCKTAVKR